MNHLSRFLLLGLAMAVACGLTGCASSKKKRDFTPVAARFFLEARDGDVTAGIRLPISEVQIVINNKPVIAEFDIASADIGQADLGKYLVFQLTPDATRDLYRLTANNQGQRLVLFLNALPVGARMIDRPFGTGTIAIFPEMPEAELPELVKNIRATSEEIQKEMAKK